MPSYLVSLSNNACCINKSIMPTLFGTIGAFGMEVDASNTLSFSFVLMYSPYVSRNTRLLVALLAIQPSTMGYASQHRKIFVALGTKIQMVHYLLTTCAEINY